MSLLQHYKSFVKQHPGLVLNLERLLHWVAWNPERFSGSEFAYEAFNAAVGLLGIYNESIIAEHPEYNATVAKYAFLLAAVEQVQTLVELRAIHLEQRGKMSRYGPLVVLEAIKTILRLRLWRSSKCVLALESVGREDTDHHESEQQLKEMLQALCRLRSKHCCHSDLPPAAEQQHYSEELTRQQIVRAAALAPNRPPAACAVAGMVRSESLGQSGSLSSLAAVGCSSNGSSSAEANPRLSSGSSASCVVCGVRSVASAESAAAGSEQCCEHCQGVLPQEGCISSSSNRAPVPGLSEISPAEQQPVTSKAPSSVSSSRKLQGSWWRKLTGLYPGDNREAVQQHQSCNTAGPGSLRASGWGPAYTAAGVVASSKQRLGSNSCNSSSSSSYWWQLQRQHQLQQLQWCLSNRDVSIGHSVMWLGELIHVLRPLIYVSLLKRYGLTSWRPWVLSLALDLASGYGLHTGQAILSHTDASRWPGSSTLYSLALLRNLSSSKWSPGERQELLARRVMLLRYLLRSPCYNTVTRRVLEKVVTGSRWIPGVGNLTEFAFNMVEGMQGLYSYVEC